MALLNRVQVWFQDVVLSALTFFPQNRSQVWVRGRVINYHAPDSTLILAELTDGHVVSVSIEEFEQDMLKSGNELPTWEKGTECHVYGTPIRRRGYVVALFDIVELMIMEHE